MLRERYDAVWQGIRDRFDGLLGSHAATTVQLATYILYDTRTNVRLIKLSLHF